MTPQQTYRVRGLLTIRHRDYDEDKVIVRNSRTTSPEKAANNVRFGLKKKYGWHNTSFEVKKVEAVSPQLLIPIRRRK